MVEVDSGDGVDLVVVERRSAENSGVVADFGSDPVGGEIHGIGENGLLPCLQSDVGVSDPVVLESQGRVDGHVLSSVAKLVSVIQKLALPDVMCFGIRESAMADEATGVVCSGDRGQYGEE